jgi:hypothetical protein
VPRRNEFSRCIGAELKVQAGYPGRATAVGPGPRIDVRWAWRSRQCDASRAECGATDCGCEARADGETTRDGAARGVVTF